MKKVLCLLTVLVMALGCTGISVSAAEYGIVLNNNVALMVGSTTVVANNSLQTVPVAPVIVDGTVLIPLRAVSEIFNGAVSYDNATTTIDIRFGADKVVVMRPGSKQYTMNGRAYEFPVAPQIINDYTMVPLRALAEDIIGKTVFYDDATKLIVISSRRVIKDSVSDAAVILTIANAITTRNLPEITVPTSYELDWGITDTGIGEIGNDMGQLNFTNIVASAEPEPDNSAANVKDGNPSTFWAIGDIGGNIVCDIGKVNKMTEIKVAFEKYTQRGANYEIYVSEDGKSYEMVYSGSSETGKQWVSHSVNGAYRYVKLVSNGNTTGSSFNSIAEIQAFNNGTSGTTNANDNAATKKTLKVTAITAVPDPDVQEENNRNNAFDGNMETRWAAQGDGSITADLGSVKTVTEVRVAWWKWQERNAKYDLEISEDGNNYTSIFSGDAAGNEYEVHAVNKKARYVRVQSHGNNTSEWNSLLELEIYGDEQASTATTTNSTASGSGYANMTSVSGEFMIAVQGTKNVLTLGSDDFTLNVSAGAKNDRQLWTKDGSSIKNKATGACLDVANQSYDEGGQICVWESNGGTNQSWELESENGYYYVKSSMSGLYLSAVGSSIQQRSKADATKWVITNGSEGKADTAVTASTGKSSFKNLASVSGDFVLVVSGSDNVLTASSGNSALSVGAYTKDAKQQWSMSGSAVKNNGTGLCLDVEGQSYDEGGSICVWEGNGGANQSWEFEKDGDGYYIKSSMSGLYLSAVGSSIQQRSKADATKWIVAAK